MVLRRDKNKPKMWRTSESLKCTRRALSRPHNYRRELREIDVLDWRIDQRSPHAITSRGDRCIAPRRANALGRPAFLMAAEIVAGAKCGVERPLPIKYGQPGDDITRGIFSVVSSSSRSACAWECMRLGFSGVAEGERDSC